MSIFNKLISRENWLAKFRTSSFETFLRITRITGGRTAQPLRKMLSHKQKAYNVGEAMSQEEARIRSDPYQEYNMLMTEAIREVQL